MDLSGNYKYKKCNRGYTLETFFNAKNKRFIAWWPSYYRKNAKNIWVPKVRMLFRELADDRVLSSATHIDLPFEALDEVNIGTVWESGKCVSIVDLETRLFDIDFGDGGWRSTTFEQQSKRNELPPFPLDAHVLHYGERDQTPLLVFELQSGGDLVIPCCEFFRAYFGSKELRRIWLTYDWRNVESRILASLDGVKDPGGWTVALPPSLRDSDAIQVAYAKYNNYANRVFKQVHSLLESGYDKQNRSFLPVVPWFKEETKIQVRGHTFNSGNSFLALQITGIAHPIGGEKINRFRPMQDKPENPAPEGAHESWDGARPDVKFKSPESLKYNDAPPTHGSARTQYLDDGMTIIGASRAINKISKDQAKTKPSKKEEGHKPSGSSGGERQGTSDGQEEGKLIDGQNTSYLTEGVLMDMWNCLIRLKQLVGEENLSVASLVPDGSYKFEKPYLIDFSKFTDEEINGVVDADEELQRLSLPPEVVKWPVLYPALNKMRGLMVLKIVYKKKPFYLVEVSRRSWESQVEDENSSTGYTTLHKEENFKGLVFESSEKGVIEIIKTMLSELRHDKGRFSKYINRIGLDSAYTFAHSKSSKQKLACAASLANAFTKVNLDIKEHLSGFI